MRRDVDAVSIALPDHWHGIVATQAARAKKDIYCEKPLAHNFREGLAMVEESERQGRIWQTGSWQRSVENFRQACELVRNGRIGKVKAIEVGLPSGFYEVKDKSKLEISPPPPTLHYDRWLGPAAEMPYREACVHINWRWNLNYGGGQLMDWVGHHVDIAHWGMGWDATGPVSVEGVGEYPPRTDPFNAATRYKVHAVYPDGTPMTIAGGYPEIKSGTKWIGDKGWVWVDRGKFDSRAQVADDRANRRERGQAQGQPRPLPRIHRLRPLARKDFDPAARGAAFRHARLARPDCHAHWAQNSVGPGENGNRRRSGGVKDAGPRDAGALSVGLKGKSEVRSPRFGVRSLNLKSEI